MIDELVEGDTYPISGTVIIEFYSDWCVPCKIVTPFFKELSDELSQVKFIKVNVDKNPSLISEFNILSVPIFVILKKGKEVNRLIGIKDKDELKKSLK